MRSVGFIGWMDFLERDLEKALDEVKAARADAKLARRESKSAQAERSSTSSWELFQAREENEKL